MSSQADGSAPLNPQIFATESLPKPSPLPNPPTQTVDNDDSRFNVTHASPLVNPVSLGKVSDISPTVESGKGSDADQGTAKE